MITIKSFDLLCMSRIYKMDSLNNERDCINYQHQR